MSNKLITFSSNFKIVHKNNIHDLETKSRIVSTLRTLKSMINNCLSNLFLKK